MSYPPERHLLRDLAMAGTRSPERSTNTIAVTPGLCHGDGIRLGVAATLIDVTGASIALQAVAPDWIATADLQAHLIRPTGADRTTTVEIECRPLRVGSGRVVIDAILRDGDGALCGTGRMAFARIPGSATTATVDDTSGAAPVHYAMDGGRPIVEPIAEQCGMTLVGPGQLRFEKNEYIRNSFGTVNGGVQALAVEAAAVSATGGGTASDLNIHYLEQIAGGPVAVTAEVVRDDGAAALCAVRIEDRSTRRLAGVADVTVTFS